MTLQYLAAIYNHMNDNKIIINVGRQFGSGGRQVALAMSRMLGIPVYDSELIAKAAEDSGFSKALFQKSDENRSIFSISSFFSTGKYGIADNYVGDNELFKIQSTVIRDIAENGSAIFLGRCSDYILRDMNCLDVFITAPMEIRCQRVAEREQIPVNQAESIVIKKDRTRETYYNYFTFGQWGTASNYDLCIDSSILGIDGTAEMIIEFGKRCGKI